MKRLDALGYGTHFTFDGFRADADLLAAPTSARELLDALVAWLEPQHRGRPLLLEEPTANGAHGADGTGGTGGASAGHDAPPAGVSAGLQLAEAYLLLHTFAPLGRLTLTAFSRRTLPLHELAERVVAHYRVGRWEASLRPRGKLLPEDPEELGRQLAGERFYAQLRLRDPLAPRPR